MKIDILTLFPEMIESLLNVSMIGRAMEQGLVEINCANIRDYTLDRHGRVDDYPYGGGAGMLMQCEPLHRALQDACKGQQVHTVLMSAQGAAFDQNKAKQLLAREHIVLVCGHYEGVDARFIEQCVDEEISLGDFVLTGGEIAACAVADAVCRMVPGVLSEAEGFEKESHYAGVLEYPQYTRPEAWRGARVPPVLLSGNHGEIEKWRRQRALEVTREKRPDMFAAFELSDEDKLLLGISPEAFSHSAKNIKTERLTLRKARPESAALVREMDGDRWLLKMQQAGNFIWIIEQGGQSAGMAALCAAQEFEGNAEVYVYLRESFRGSGYATEALESVIKYGFEKLDLRRIQGWHVDGDRKAASVMRTAGMRYEGMLRRYYDDGMRDYDCHVYSILRGE